MPRISRYDYVPSDEDAVYVYRPVRSAIGSGSCSRFANQRASWAVIDLPRCSGNRKKWIHHFEGISSIIVTVDLRDYARSLCEDESRTIMSEHAILWDSIVNSRWFRDTGAALCFIKYTEFAKMLKTKPYDRCFSSEACQLQDPSDPEQVKTHIVDHFLSLNRHSTSNTSKIFFIPDIPCADHWALVKDFLFQSQCARRAKTNAE